MHLIAKLAGAAFVTTILSGCAVEGTTEEGSVSGASALVGQDSYLYFRCNATSWNVDNTTRLRSTQDPYVFSLLYEVTQEWMKTSGDNCQFTETNQLNGWGTVQTNYGAVHGLVNVPGGDYLQTNGAGFQAKYPELGRYKVTANWMQGTFQIAAASGADVSEAWQPCGGSKVTTVTQSPQVPANVFVGCSNGDVFLSFNGVAQYPTWQKVDTWNTSAGTFNLPDLPVNALAYSPADTKTAYVAFAGSKQGHKLWKTSTGGANWLELSSVPLAEIWSISVNPLDTAKVYVFGPGGVFMSPDAGTTWTASATVAPLTVPIAAGAKISTVSVAAGKPDVIWVGATNGDVFFTTNARSGQTWVKATHDMPQRAVTHVALDASRTPVAAYATFDGMYNDSVWVTTNNGFGWANIQYPALPTTPMALPGIYAFYGISVNPVVNTVLYIDGTYGTGMSTSGGANWSWASTN